MIETDKYDDNERTTRARAVYVKIRVVKERRDVTGVCISGQGRLHGLHEPVHRAVRLRGNTERASEAATGNARDTVGEKHRTCRLLGEDHPGQ